MKRVIKKLSILIASIAMIFAMAFTTVNADDKFTITITNDKTGHNYLAYQIFAGDLSGNVLSNITWGSGVNEEDLLAALQEVDAYAECVTAADVAKVLASFDDNSAEIDAFAAIVGQHLTMSAGSATEPIEGEYTITGLDAGYYLVKDGNKVTGQDAATKFILKLVKNITVTPKSDVPTVEKKVQEDDKYTPDDGYGQGYNDVADWNIGDAVPFKLIGTLPANFADYDTYQYIFHDTLSSGLTLNEDSVKVYVAGDKAGTNKSEISSWNLYSTSNSFTVTFDDLKAVKGVDESKYIIVEYTATLNENAVIGLDGNPNEVYLEFSNNPNQEGEGDTGSTPKDKVIVFTYELDTTKVDGENREKLKDAEFKLHDENGKWVIVDNDGNVTGWADTEANGSTLTSDENGLFKVIGLDDGTYYLKETKAPDGYNLLTSEIKIVISATTVNGQNWTTGVASEALTALTVIADDQPGTSNVNSGIVSVEVENNQGSTLPSTGGIGNYVFYGVGIVLMAGAIFYFVRKRKMN